MVKKKEGKIESQEDVAKKVLEQLGKSENKKEEPGINFMEFLNNPAVASFLEGGKNLFKKEKADPNMCEINIKAPSEVVLKLFNIKE